MTELNSLFLEKIMIKNMMVDRNFLVLVSSVFEPEYFDDPYVSEIFKFSKNHVEEFKSLPPKEAIINSSNDPQELRDFFESVESIDFNTQESYDYLITQTNEYLKEQALKRAIMDTVDIVESGGNREQIREKIENALCKDIKVDLGLDYFNELGSRLKKIFTHTDIRVPTYFSQLDEYINGGFPPFTLSVIVARIHGFKCLCYNSQIYIKINKKVRRIEIGRFFDEYINTCKNEYKEEVEMPSLESFKNKHGEEKGLIKYKEWRKNLSKGKKGKNSIQKGISKEHKKVENIQVFTDKGFVDINYVIKTIPFKKYIVLFESGKEIECADRHAFIDIEDKEIIACELREGDLIKSEEGFDIVFDVFETDDYEEMYDLNLSNHHKFYSSGILSHNSNTMANFAARQVLRGHNVVSMTLEMSEDMYAQRFDSIYSLMDINRMYHGDENQGTLVRKLRDIKNIEGRGNLYIKQFPTGKASVRDFRIYLRELIMRGVEPSILYVDYINLMRSAYSNGNNGLYEKVKGIAEELRALSFEFGVPVVSVSQLNREGGFVGFEELDFNYIAESLGLPATSDFMAIFGVDEEALVYQSEVHYKIGKNRLGGRVGENDKLYFDSRTLKMYDSTEMELWISDSEISGDDRDLAEQRQNREENNRRNRRR